MINIRRGVFETNSSSSHSIVVKNGDDQYETKEYFDSLYNCREYDRDTGSYKKSPNYDLTWESEELEFGRAPFRILYDFSSKLLYVIAYYQNNQNMMDEILKVVQKYTGCTKIKYPKMRDGEEDYKGFIDHQSLGILGSLINSGVTIEEFLTNRKYFVVIDGDEYRIWKDMKLNGVVNTDNIEKEF